MRAAISEALQEIAVLLEQRPADLHDLQASDLPETIRVYADEVVNSGSIPCSIRVDMEAQEQSDTDYTIDVFAMSAAVWSGISIEMGVVSPALAQAVMLDGLTGELGKRGQEIARELLEEPAPS